MSSRNFQIFIFQHFRVFFSRSAPGWAMVESSKDSEHTDLKSRVIYQVTSKGLNMVVPVLRN